MDIHIMTPFRDHFWPPPGNDLMSDMCPLLDLSEDQYETHSLSMKWSVSVAVQSTYTSLFPYVHTGIAYGSCADGLHLMDHSMPC